MFISEHLCPCLCFGISSMLPWCRSLRYPEGISGILEKRPLERTWCRGRKTVPPLSLGIGPLSQLSGANLEQDPRTQGPPAGHWNPRQAGPPNPWHGSCPPGSPLRVAGPVARSPPPLPLNRLPQTQCWWLQPCVVTAWGFRGLPGGRCEGGGGGVCRNERGWSRLLETNFTNDFCNN